MFQKMPKYYEDKEEVDKQPKVACSGLRDDLKECLLKSDCVRVVRTLVTPQLQHGLRVTCEMRLKQNS